MMRSFATAVAALLLPALLVVSPVRAEDAASLKAGVFNPSRPAPDFSLQGSDGAELKLSRFRGKVVVLFFGFTSCPVVCPTTLATLVKVHKDLGEQADQLQVVYITVDPETDKAERMRQFLGAFDASFLGGTGSEEQLAAVREAYGVFAARQATADGVTYSHSSYTYLIDRQGNLRALMPYGQSAEDYVHDLRILMAQ